jgi:hypothetical protein
MQRLKKEQGTLSELTFGALFFMQSFPQEKDCID